MLIYTEDLLFGSKLAGAVQQAGYDNKLCLTRDQLSTEAKVTWDALVIDLSVAAQQRLAAVKECGLFTKPVLACYAHVEPHVKQLAETAGCHVVVPRSRFMRQARLLLNEILAVKGSELQ